MLYLDLCGGGQATELVLRAHGVLAQALVVELFGGESALPAPIEEVDGARRYEEPAGRDLAGVPVIVVDVTIYDEACAVVEARYGGCVTRLTEAPAGRATHASMRPASARECVTLALHWCFAVDRSGCHDPIETIFRGARALAEAWVVDLPVKDAALASPLSGYEETTQVWRGRFPSLAEFEQVGRLFGTTSGDTWPVHGAERCQQVLVAAFTSVEGDPPTRPTTPVDHSHLFDEE